MDIVKTLVLLMVVSMLALLIIWCGPPSETEKDEEEETKEDRIDIDEISDVPVEIKNSVGMDLKLIQPGSFMMGASPGDSDAESDEKPQHRVEITKAFYIGVYEVTQSQWQAVMGTTVRNQRDKVNPDWPIFGEGLKHPIYYVNRLQAKEFCRNLSQKEGLTYRLPTEAEWEYTCGAGTTTRYFWGHNMDDQYAWYDDNSGGETHEVGLKLPNAWGLYDMSGNVWEWCEDWYGSYSSTSQTDPKGPASGEERVVRGGSWYAKSGSLRSSNRLGISKIGFDYFGFRVVREVNE